MSKRSCRISSSTCHSPPGRRSRAATHLGAVQDRDIGVAIHVARPQHVHVVALVRAPAGERVGRVVRRFVVVIVLRLGTVAPGADGGIDRRLVGGQRTAQREPGPAFADPPCRTFLVPAGKEEERSQRDRDRRDPGHGEARANGHRQPLPRNPAQAPATRTDDSRSADPSTPAMTSSTGAQMSKVIADAEPVGRRVRGRHRRERRAAVRGRRGIACTDGSGSRAWSRRPRTERPPRRCSPPPGRS